MNDGLEQTMIEDVTDVHMEEIKEQNVHETQPQTKKFGHRIIALKQKISKTDVNLTHQEVEQKKSNSACDACDDEGCIMF